MMAASYARVEHTLRALGCDIGAAECHGILCGMLCGPRRFELRPWLSHLSGQDDVSAYAAGSAGEVLAALAASARDALAQPDYSFTLLLPDERAPLAERAAAFAAWCRGFLAGLGLGGIVDVRRLGEDARDFLADVERFTRLALDGAGDEDEERALSELTEFTRMGAMIVHAECQAQGARAAEPPALH